MSRPMALTAALLPLASLPVAAASRSGTGPAIRVTVVGNALCRSRLSNLPCTTSSTTSWPATWGSTRSASSPSTRGPSTTPDQIRLVESMSNHHRIASITLSDDDFLRDEYPSDYRVVTQEGRESKTRRYMIDHQFVKTMGLEVIGGRDFSQAKGNKESVVLISESAVAPLGLADPVGETVELMRVSPSGRKSGGHYRIVGVVKDFTFESGYEESPPGLLALHPGLPGEGELMLVRVKPGDLQEVLQHLRQAWSGVVDYSDFDFSFLQQDLEAAYRDELRWRRVITWAVACPLAGWWMRDWLDGFAFRIDLAPWHFTAGTAIALGAVLVSAGHQAWRAARADPVRALRYE